MLLASAICKYIAEKHQKPGRSWVEARLGMPWPEFYTPKGRFYLILGWGLRVLGFVIFVIWVFVLWGYE